MKDSNISQEQQWGHYNKSDAQFTQDQVLHSIHLETPFTDLEVN